MYFGGGGCYGASGSLGSSISSGGTYSTNSIYMNDTVESQDLGDLTMDSLSYNSSEDSSKKQLESLVAVGAGDHVDQKITYVQGLIKPLFSETVRVKYLWWDALVDTLKANNIPAPQASGFPGDKNKGINLGSTPRIDSYAGQAFPRAEARPMFSRV
jgi:hypothetical protein